jgi:hypothetical protein
MRRKAKYRAQLCEEYGVSVVPAGDGQGWFARVVLISSPSASRDSVIDEVLDQLNVEPECNADGSLRVFCENGCEEPVTHRDDDDTPYCNACWLEDIPVLWLRGPGAGTTPAAPKARRKREGAS